MIHAQKYGPDIRISHGKVGKATIIRLIENEAGNGFTALLAEGGVLSLVLTPQAQLQHRRRSRDDWPESRRAALTQVLEYWGDATGKAFRHNLEWHSEQLGLPYAEVRAGCFINPGRTPPPLRAEYERAQARRRDSFNKMKAERRIGGKMRPHK